MLSLLGITKSQDTVTDDLYVKVLRKKYNVLNVNFFALVWWPRSFHPSGLGKH